MRGFFGAVSQKGATLFSSDGTSSVKEKASETAGGGGHFFMRSWILHLRVQAGPNKLPEDGHGPKLSKMV